MLPLEISLIERRNSRSKFHSSDLKDRADSSPVLSQSPINFLEEWLRESHCPLLTRCRNGPLQPFRNLLNIIRDDWGCVRGLCAVDHLRYRGHLHAALTRPRSVADRAPDPCRSYENLALLTCRCVSIVIFVRRISFLVINILLDPAR